MRRSLVLLGIVVPLTAASDAHALDPYRKITQYAQSRFEARDGLAHNLVNSLAQTADGFLWAGSEEGLTRYDGATFTSFDHRRTEGVPTNTFSALAVDPQGMLWAATRDKGLLRLVDGGFRAVRWESGAASAQIRALAFDRSGDLWVGLRDRGLVLLRQGNLVMSLTTREGLPSDEVRTIVPARDGSVWLGTFRGLARWQAGRILPGPPALDGVVIDEIAEDARGTLWCATASGLARVRGDDVAWIGADRLPTTGVRQILFDRDGNLWIGTGKGVARMTPDGEIALLARPIAMVLALFEDSEGNLWIGTEGGLDRLRDGDVVPVGGAEGIPETPVFTVREDATGAMWAGSTEGLFRFAPGATAATKITGEHGTMFGIFPDTRGDVWFGARDGSVGRWRDGQFSWLGRRPSWERVRTFAEAANGMWIGTDNGLFLMSGDRLDDAEAVVSGVAVSAIAIDARGALWLATGRGLLCWRDGAIVPLPAGGPPTDTSATTVQFDPDGTVWVTTEGAGLWRLRDGRWASFTSKDGMFDDLIWRILEDGRGVFWMSSNRGIWSISRQQFEDHAAGRRRRLEYVLYGEADGMRDRECDGSMEPAGWRSRDGRLWFPTIKGLAVIDPAHLHTTQLAHAVIDTVRVDGEPQPLREPLQLAAGASRLELAYTAPALRHPDRVRFRYQLEGFDRAWNDAGLQRVAQYTNLPPGDYRFVVQAGQGGSWGRTRAIDITLAPHFYQTRGFLALAILAAVLAITAVPLLRIRQLRARARELAERIREAVHELAEREQRLRDTQAQLVEASRQAGRSDVATAVLHNVGNVLNSVNVSASVVSEIVSRLKTGNLSKVAGLIGQHREDLARFIGEDPRGQKLPEYFSQLGDSLDRDKAAALTELRDLTKHLEHIKTVVQSQQSHVVPSQALETFEVHQLLEDAIKLSPASRDQDGIAIVRRLEAFPPIRLDRHKALQILVNLLANARDAVIANPPGARTITVRARPATPGQLEITITDNGCGIEPHNLEKVFQLGFTTKPNGNGLGLHYSACAALELHGKVTAQSEGPGSGASFVLVLPLEPVAAAA